MLEPLRPGFRFGAIALTIALLAACLPAGAEDKKPAPPDKGLRVYTSGHSFHYFVPPILTDMAKGAGIEGHKAVGLSAIGGSRVIQHWNVPEDKNKLKEALRAGKVDVRSEERRVGKEC